MPIGVDFSAEASVSELIVALGNGIPKLPIKTDIRHAIGKDAGDTVGTTWGERIDWLLSPVRAGAIATRVYGM